MGAYYNNCNSMNCTNMNFARSCEMPCDKRHHHVMHRHENMVERNENVEVECVCQVTPASDCHRQDEMETLSCQFPVVMAYVPWQQWGDLYDGECGLMQGTIFRDLNYIFCGERC